MHTIMRRFFTQVLACNMPTTWHYTGAYQILVSENCELAPPDMQQCAHWPCMKM